MSESDRARHHRDDDFPSPIIFTVRRIEIQFPGQCNGVEIGRQPAGDVLLELESSGISADIPVHRDLVGQAESRQLIHE